MVGLDWPTFGFAMTGLARLDQLQRAIEQVLLENVEGNFIECGVWRGGIICVNSNIVSFEKYFVISPNIQVQSFSRALCYTRTM